jgi:Protein of unknown function (DUF664)
MLLGFLDAQRASVLAMVDGFDEGTLRTPVVPSGWTPLGLIEHLSFAERYWFRQVAAGPAQGPAPARRAQRGRRAPFSISRPAAVVPGFYRDQCARANAVLDSAPPRGRAYDEIADEVTDLRWIVLHVIEETARHGGTSISPGN